MVCLQPEPFVQLGEIRFLRRVIAKFFEGRPAELVADEDLKNFIWDLGKEGFVLQLISLAGLHCDAVSFGM